jgi:hypothetical protein
MTPPSPDPIRTAAEAVTRLIDVCRKGGPLYARNPHTVAQVNRTAKWLLNALDRLQQETGSSDRPPA